MGDRFGPGFRVDRLRDACELSRRLMERNAETMARVFEARDAAVRAVWDSRAQLRVGATTGRAASPPAPEEEG